MITRALDENHDWTFGRGRQNYLRDNDAIIQTVNTRLNSFLGDCFFAAREGVDWWRLMGGKDRASLLVQVRSVILGTEGVTGITAFDFSEDISRRKIFMRYSINTTFTTNISSTQEVALNA